MTSQPPPPYPTDDKQPGPGAPVNTGYGVPPPAGPGAPVNTGYGVPPPAGYQPMYGQPPPPAPGQPGQPGYPQQGMTTVTVVQPGVMTSQMFRETPVRTKCPACSAEVLTSIHFETGTFAWLIALVLCLFGLWLGCCLIPLCIDGCKDVVHSCPNCRHTIAKYNRM